MIEWLVLAALLIIGSVLIAFFWKAVTTVYDWVFFILGLIVMGIMTLGLAIVELGRHAIYALRSK